MFRDKRLLCILSGLVLCSQILLLPLQADAAVKLTLEQGRHELIVHGETIVVETSEALIIQVTKEGSLIKGVIEAADRNRSSRVKITLIGPPDRVIYDGEVRGPETFEADADETGHAEL